MKTVYKFARCAVSFLLLAIMLVACAPAGNPASSVPGEVFRVGVECACAPFNWTQLDDSYGAMPLADGTFAGGYDVEIAKLLADGLGMELEIVKIEWDGLTPSLTSGKIDAILADMSPTEERKQTIDFSDIYYKSDLVIVVRKDSRFVNAESLADFSGAKMTGQLNTLLYDVLDQIPNVDKQEPLEDHPAMIMATRSGVVDGYVCERPNAISAATANEELTFVSFDADKGFNYDGTEVSIAVGLQKNSPLKDRINEILAGISEQAREELMEQCIRNQPLNAG